MLDATDGCEDCSVISPRTLCCPRNLEGRMDDGTGSLADWVVVVVVVVVGG